MGYDQNFIENHSVHCPKLADRELTKFKKANLNPDNFYLDYINYSVLQNPFRKFPYYSAANIDGGLFKEIPRVGNWRADASIGDSEQSGVDLYAALSARAPLVIHKGHMTKREDVQWGTTKAIAESAADSTFHFTNAVPQHSRINLSIWKQIENYILHKETITNKLKICLFTGPILNKKDPLFVSDDESINIQLPVLFWKVIYYLDNESRLNRTAFIVNQSSLLENHNVINTSYLDDDQADFFQGFSSAKTYQTTVTQIEDLTPLIFDDDAIEKYNDPRPTKLLETDTDYLSFNINQLPDINQWEISNLIL